MVDWLQVSYNSSFYGYINGDILVHSSLDGILKMLSSQQISSHLLVVGRRYNTYVDPSFSEFLTTREMNDRFILDNTRLNEQFIPVAQDYFIFTKHTFTKRNVLPVVIGRNRYDNYLVTICKLDPSCNLIDASQSSISFLSFVLISYRSSSL